ncbi:MAG: NYN domain-containing protein [Paludisphaera borealis]|uniref:NYN domain-containing protein n=1 Tax=Paludisphaera borealis TaxID=1387353 RepID=UPI002847D58D|nr:NYN domain-containing protein [Paludisphaera borealis]MDR3622769.1 NYN domain-containing protein [Paludisphaera borealis]
MTLNVYVDAFNLYYGCLMDTPYKWLDLRTLCALSFPDDQIQDIHYFTARIKPNSHDPDKHVRQETYLRALRTLPGLHIREGTYSRKAVKLPLHPLPAPPTPPTLVKVLKNEEKGSDVNLATRLLIDAFDKAFDAAVVITNDSDLAEPIHQVRRKFGYRVMILHSCSRPGRGPSIELRKATGLRGGGTPLIVQEAHLVASQFPPTMIDAHGAFHKPAAW